MSLGEHVERNGRSLGNEGTLRRTEAIERENEVSIGIKLRERNRSLGRVGGEVVLDPLLPDGLDFRARRSHSMEENRTGDVRWKRDEGVQNHWEIEGAFWKKEKWGKVLKQIGNEFRGISRDGCCGLELGQRSQNILL